MTDVRQKGGWLWVTFVAVGVFDIAFYIYKGRTDWKLFLFGLAALLMAPQAFFRFPSGLSITLILAALGALLAILLPFLH